MKAAHVLATQRNDMINFVLNARLDCSSLGFFVKLLYFSADLRGVPRA